MSGKISIFFIKLRSSFHKDEKIRIYIIINSLKAASFSKIAVKAIASHCSDFSNKRQKWKFNIQMKFV